MKNWVLLCFVAFSFSAVAQNDSIVKSEDYRGQFGVNLGIGHLNTNTILNEKVVSGTLFSPQIEFGKRFKFEIGLTFLSVDTLLYPQLEKRQNNVNVGLGFSEYIGNSSFYGKGSYSLLVGGSKEIKSIGHRISGEIGLTATGVKVDFYVQAGKFFDNRQIYTGNTLSFGVRLWVN